MTTQAALRAHEKRVAGMLADPDLVGDLLLVGLVFARALDLGDPPLDEKLVNNTWPLVYGQATHSPHMPQWPNRQRPNRGLDPAGGRRVIAVLRTDIRRYSADWSKSYWCQRPVKRRKPVRVPAPENMIVFEGETPAPPELCSRQASYTNERYLFTDPVDGSRHAIGACSQTACKRWLVALREANERELAANPPPVPAANLGGVLERHLDEIDWVSLYQWLDPTWTPPHEAPGWRPPKLQILPGDDLPDGVVRERPALSVVKGGWR